MSNKTINQALTDLYLGLGGDSKELEDNTKVSDYIEDLEGAIKGAMPEGLPEVTSSDEGKVLSVSSNGEWAKSKYNNYSINNFIGTVKITGNTTDFTPAEGMTTDKIQKIFSDFINGIIPPPCIKLSGDITTNILVFASFVDQINRIGFVTFIKTAQGYDIHTIKYTPMMDVWSVDTI